MPYPEDPHPIIGETDFEFRYRLSYFKWWGFFWRCWNRYGPERHHWRMSGLEK